MGLTDERGQQRNHRHRKTRSQCQALGGGGGQREAVLWASGPLVWAAAIREASTGAEAGFGEESRPSHCSLGSSGVSAHLKGPSPSLAA